MRKGHRSFHHVFWYFALPALMVWLLFVLPKEDIDIKLGVPPGGDISIVDPLQ